MNPRLADLTEQYLERHAPRKRSGRDDRAMLTTHLAVFRTRKLTDLNRNDVARLHAQVGETAPYRANRLVALLRKMFNLARDWGLYSGENPATRIQMFREESRDRFVQPEELPRLFQAIAEEADPVCPRGRADRALDRRKTDRSVDHAVGGCESDPGRVADPAHQGRAPASLARAACARRPAPEPPQGGRESLCVSWADGVGHLQNMKRAWDRIRVKAGIPDVRFHDLRRTVGSWLAASGESLHLIGKVLNHRDVSTTAILCAIEPHPVRQALERHASNKCSRRLHPPDSRCHENRKETVTRNAQFNFLQVGAH